MDVRGYGSVVSQLRDVRSRPWGWHAHCPVHEAGRGKHKHSLSVRIGRTGALMLKCHVGCSLDSIVKALGVELKDLFPAKDQHMSRTQTRKNGHQKPSGLTRYEYHDEHGKLLYRVVRTPDKKFWQEVRDKDGRWQRGLGETRRVLYRLPEIVAAGRGRKVLIPEGEKDVDNLRKLGFLATCNPMGGGKWNVKSDAGGENATGNHYSECLAGFECIILGDNDPIETRLGFRPGMRHVDLVAEALRSHARSIRKIYSLPGVPPKGDVSDWIEAGGTKERLIELIQKTPVWDGAEACSYQAENLASPASADELKNERAPAAQSPNGESTSLQKQFAAKICEKAGYLSAEDWLLVSRQILVDFEGELRKNVSHAKH